jgi:predicted house-cleaning noncanonical NTP pyrophosphatase (MazG superfamily)
LTNDIDPETGFPTMTQKEAIDLVLKLSKAQRELVGADAAQKLDIKATAKVEERVEDVDAAQLARFMELGEKMARAGLVSHGAVDERREEVIAEARRVGIRLVPDDD